MDSIANITFTALNGNHDPSERILSLKSDGKPIQIGRASKNSTKGLSGAKDNAWFDSPVMSRNHAHVSLKNNTITIEDIGSMHGTYLNNQQLQANEIRPLDNNDVLVFGAEVKRGEETFPACAFRVTYAIMPSKATNTFTYPDVDSSEDEEEEDYEISESENENENGFGNESPFSEDDMSIKSHESSPVKASQSINAIDLTKEDSPDAYSAGAAINGAEATETHFDIINQVAATSSAPIFVDSDEEDEGLSTDSDNQDDNIESEVLSIHDSYESDESEDSEEEDCIEANPADFADRASLASPEVEDMEAQDTQFDPFWSKTGSSMHVRTLIEVPDQIMGEDDDESNDDYGDDESDFGLSKAGSEGLQKLREDGLLDKIETNPIIMVAKDIVVVGGSLPKIVASGETLNDADKPSTFAGLCWDNPTRDSTSKPIPSQGTFGFDFQQSQVEDRPTLPGMNLRQPSPSDAAMVKSATPPSGFGVRVSHLPSSEFVQQLATQSLGDKTGKHEFFAARLHNKSVLGSESKDDVRLAPPALHGTILAPDNTYQELKRQRSIQAASSRLRERRRAAMGEPLPSDISTPAKPFTAQLPFLDDHAQVRMPERSPSPELDMTSAVKYNESKVTMAAANKTAAQFAGRSGLRINDIIDDSSADQTPKAPKRKAEEISDVIENEVREWASSSPLEVSVGSTDVIASPEAGSAQLGETIPNNPADVPEQRPVKKLRRFVERLGYAALGGAAVGAGLFSALVATAPDFL